MANRFFNANVQYLDASGNLLASGKLYFYVTGTSTLATTYSDSTLTTANANPVVLNSLGRLGDVFLDPAVTYKAVLKDSADVTIWTADPVVDPAANVTAAIQVFAGDPSGNVAGNAGTVGGAGASMVYDISNEILYICTTTGTVATAVWQNVAATLTGGIAETGVITPSTLAANTNNYEPTGGSGATTWRIQASSAINITGIAGGAAGRKVRLINIGTTRITLKTADTGSTAANRFTTGDYFGTGSGTDSDVLLDPDYTVTLHYDNVSTRWRIESIVAILPLGNQQFCENAAFALSVAANALTIALKTAAGNDPSPDSPVVVAFRSTTAVTGTFTKRMVTAALSVVVSAGSTLGFGNSETNLIHIGFIDNAGTIELAVSQDGAIWTEDRVISTTAEGGIGAADSRTVVYSTSARSSVACRLAAVATIQTGATAGNWSNAPSRLAGVASYPVQPFKNTIKAWGNANGAGTTLNDSFNISSITDNGTGDITFTYAVAMASANYSTFGLAQGISGVQPDNGISINSTGGLTTGAARLFGYDGSGGELEDPTLYTFGAVGW